MPPRFTRNSDRPRASDRTMVDTEDTRTRLQRFPTRSASSPSADEPHGWQQARAKPLERIGGHTYYSGLDVEKQSRSGQSGAFFLTFLFIELIDSSSARSELRGWRPRSRARRIWLPKATMI